MTNIISSVVAPGTGLCLYLLMTGHNPWAVALWPILGTVALLGFVGAIIALALAASAPRCAAGCAWGWPLFLVVIVALISTAFCALVVLVTPGFGSADHDAATTIGSVLAAAVVAFASIVFSVFAKFGYGAFARFIVNLKYADSFPNNSPRSKEVGFAAAWEAVNSPGGGALSFPSNWSVLGAAAGTGAHTVTIRGWTTRSVARRLSLIQQALQHDAESNASAATDNTARHTPD